MKKLLFIVVLFLPFICTSQKKFTFIVSPNMEHWAPIKNDTAILKGKKPVFTFLHNEGKSPLLYNIVKNNIELKVEDGYEYKLIDVQGRVLQRGILNIGMNNIPIHSLLKGVMFITINKRTYKIIKL